MCAMRRTFFTLTWANQLLSFCVFCFRWSQGQFVSERTEGKLLLDREFSVRPHAHRKTCRFSASVIHLDAMTRIVWQLIYWFSCWRKTKSRWRTGWPYQKKWKHLFNNSNNKKGRHWIISLKTWIFRHGSHYSQKNLCLVFTFFRCCFTRVKVLHPTGIINNLPLIHYGEILENSQRKLMWRIIDYEWNAIYLKH